MNHKAVNTIPIHNHKFTNDDSKNIASGLINEKPFHFSIIPSTGINTPLKSAVNKTIAN